MPNSYHIKTQIDRSRRIQELLKELPDVCSDYFLAIEQVTSTLTRMSYCYDLRLFFQYLSKEIPRYNGKAVHEFTIEDIRKITKQDIERFARYLSLYIKSDYEFDENDEDSGHLHEVTNHEYGIKRKFSSIRAFYRYLFNEGLIDSNTAALVALPKLHEKPIIHLDIDEVSRILDLAENGAALPKTYQKYHNITAKRDLALLSIFLGTGIRISECVGLNIDDIDFEQNAFLITRKGGKEVILYFSDEVADALKDYYSERKNIETLPGHENAFFLSIQRRRITQRAVENMVKKYARIAAPLKKKISPHKLRSTFGTNLYRETGDIYLVADVLGHSDVNTTRKHYAATSEENRRIAAAKTVLRGEPHK